MIASNRLASYVRECGMNLSDEDYERLWIETIEEFLASEPISDEAQSMFKALPPIEKIAHFSYSTFSLANYRDLARRTLQTCQC